MRGVSSWGSTIGVFDRPSFATSFPGSFVSPPPKGAREENNGNNILKNWDPSHEHKFVTKTRDRPEPGSFFPRSLWGGEMKDPGNEVASFVPVGHVGI